MIKSIIKLAFVLVVGVLVYNFFLGTPEEKERSRNIFNQGKEIVHSVVDLAKDEKEKFNKGKYDEALDKVGNLFDDVRDKAKEFKDEDYLGDLERLEEKRKELKDYLNEIEAEAGDELAEKSVEEKREQAKGIQNVKSRMKDLMNQTENLLEDMNKKDGEQ